MGLAYQMSTVPSELTVTPCVTQCRVIPSPLVPVYMSLYCTVRTSLQICYTFSLYEHVPWLWPNFLFPSFLLIWLACFFETFS